MALMVAASIAATPAAAQVADEAATLAATAARGRLMAAYDRAAWLGTDDVQARLTDWRDRLGGWIVDGPVESPTIVFHDRSQPPRALYSARLERGSLTGATLVQGDAAVLAPERLRLIAARDAAGKAMGAAGVRPCSSAFNTVVVPPATPDGPTAVYFLSAQAKANDLPVGGHFRVMVAADGTAGAPHAFSRGCMTLSPDGKAKAIAVGVVTTLTGPLPNEAHVFVVEAYRKPLLVLVPGPPQRGFMVEPGRPIAPFELNRAKGGR
ncbi:hypothetical protein [Sphingomonas sp. VNH70]|uniref:hypothetical protein n=1 Tax=Sphingomonas silueang TaxID=3156617 RepID=UPI0032B4F102